MELINTVLILGSEGFIGSHLVQYFIEKGWAVTGCDVVEASPATYTYQKLSVLSADFPEILQQQAFTACINAAGSGNVSYSVQHPLSDFHFNTVGTVHVLDGLRKYKPACKYVHLSSAAVYGNPVSLPITEKAVLAPVSPYGWHKLQSEMACAEYYQVFGVPSVVLRPFSVYGPGLRKQLFWDVLQKWNASKSGISLWGTGLESRDFIYISDLAEAIYTLLEKAPMQAECYNIAAGEETTIKDAITEFFKQLSEPCEVAFNGQSKPGDPIHWRADVSALKAFGYGPSVSLAQGLQQTTAWMRQYI